MKQSKDFTDDFLKILRSGFNSEEELESAFNKAKAQYAKEKEEKEKAKKEEALKKTEVQKAYFNLYTEYLRYLSKKYPEFKPSVDTEKVFKEELDFVDYAVGASKSLSKKYNLDNLSDDTIAKLFEKIFS